MFILDLSQVMISNLMVVLGKDKDKTELDVNLLRHFVLNSIRSYRSKYKNEYGEMIIACDSIHSWRKNVFPYYKANRKKNREESKFDWKVFFEGMSLIREELREHFPYRIIQLNGAEADDVIATLCHEFGNTNEKILILSGDKDFRQLQSYMNVEQYDPTRKKWMKENQAELYLKEHIMRGDKGDGIPNFLSKDDCLVLDERMKSISQKKLDGWLNMKPEDFCDERMLRGYRRNEQLIDLSKIPEDISKSIMISYNDQANKPKKNLMNYFIQNRLKNLMESIGDF
jgi:5'-3' exonuclease